MGGTTKKTTLARTCFNCSSESWTVMKTASRSLFSPWCRHVVRSPPHRHTFLQVNEVSVGGSSTHRKGPHEPTENTEDCDRHGEKMRDLDK